MEPPRSEVRDEYLIAAMLNSEATLRAIQRQLKACYPDRVISSGAIRRVLHAASRRAGMLSYGRTEAASAGEGSFRTNKALPCPEVASSAALLTDADEPLRDILWYDMVYSSWGG